MDELLITEVSPRDGLQSLPEVLPADARSELVCRLAAAGLKRIELGAFVSPRAVPQMAGTAEVLAQVEGLPGLIGSVLVPNLRGLALAREAGARGIAVVLGATETLNRRNIGLGLVEASREARQTLHNARALGLQTRAYMAVAFACPYEGAVDAAVVQALAEALHAAGAQEVVIADTIGAAAPAQIKALLVRLAQVLPVERLALHLHDTRGLACANVWAALEAGVRRFDSSAGGLGGCPFAPGAAGNLATEDLVLLAEQCGLRTGVNLAALYDAIEHAAALTGRRCGGRSAAWWRRAHRSGTESPQPFPQETTR